MKKIVISCGPIPARLDSVKYITNRFKGGLAFQTAAFLARTNPNVTIIKWRNTPFPEYMENNIFKEVIDVDDVFDYYRWFEEHAAQYDAFIMAAAVANLAPSNPYKGKFPSHTYRVGEKFNIEFEIAPRAIDIVKQKNPRCCLIGYKLFDAESDEELIEIARHTLADAKANVIFANTPAEAKTRKIAVTPDGAAINMTFDEHLRFIQKAINADYFSTKVSIESISDFMAKADSATLNKAYRTVEYFERTFPKFGTISINAGNGYMVTTSRGHSSGPVIVTGVDFKNRIVYCVGGKATLNAPTMYKALELMSDDNSDGTDNYIVHRHFTDPIALCNKYGNSDNVIYKEYEFPGTAQELDVLDGFDDKKILCIKDHGFLVPKHIQAVDWNRYYEMFPERYFGTRPEIQEVIDILKEDKKTNKMFCSLEVGGNKKCDCDYNLDPFMAGSNVIDYESLGQNRFDFIIARNSISYLSNSEIFKIIASLKPGGLFIANTFDASKEYKISGPDEKMKGEVAVRFGSKDAVYLHNLIIKDDIYSHSFYARPSFAWTRMGFEVEFCRNSNTLIIRHIKK